MVAVASTSEDGARAQQKLFRLLQKGRGGVVLTEAEINAFLSRSVEPSALPFDQPVVFLQDDDMVEIAGHVDLGRLVAAGSPALADMLPAAWMARPVSLRVAAHAVFEQAPRAQLRLDVRQLTLGRQPVPAFTLHVLFEAARLRFLRIALPDGVTDVRIERGRVLIEATSSRGRT